MLHPELLLDGGTALFTASFAIIVALLVGIFGDRIGAALHLIDHPDVVGGRKRHVRPTPLVGGLAVVPVLVTIIAFIAVFSGIPSVDVRQTLLSMAALIALFFVLGLIDDRHELSPRIRLLVSAAAFTTASLAAPDLSLQVLHWTWPSTPWMLGGVGAIVLTMVAYIGLLNAVNMADGKNGLVIGVSIIWSLLLLTEAPAPMVPVLVAAVAALAVILRFNLANRLFLGDGGAYGLSAFFGLMVVYVYNQRAGDLAADQVVLWLLIPVIDCIRLVVWRTLRGQSPFQGGRDHLHHYLARTVGWDRGKYLYWGMVGIPGGVSVLWPAATPVLILLTLAAYSFILYASARGIRAAAVPAE
jgi:UDP-GlcNAc:undecaprenyl-phosphate/decaprenyl-phosphate GlcNAc-1-phosphate transferase